MQQQSLCMLERSEIAKETQHGIPKHSARSLSLYKHARSAVNLPLRRRIVADCPRSMFFAEAIRLAFHRPENVVCAKMPVANQRCDHLSARKDLESGVSPVPAMERLAMHSAPLQPVA